MAHVPKAGPLDAPSPAKSGPVKSGKSRAALAVEAADDRELVRRAQREDKEAFEELIRRHQHRVFAVAGGILNRREDVEDINARKSWLIGRSGDASALNINDRGLGTARMIGFGHGLEAQMLPERLRHTIAEQVAAERAAARPRAATAPKRR